MEFECEASCISVSLSLSFAREGEANGSSPSSESASESESRILEEFKDGRDKAFDMEFEFDACVLEAVVVGLRVVLVGLDLIVFFVVCAGACRGGLNGLGGIIRYGCGLSLVGLVCLDEIRKI